LCAVLAAIAGLAACVPSFAADAPDAKLAEFYRGKTINLLIGVNVGAAYDLQGRLIARHLRQQIPGQPTIVVQNMVGAGGLKMANYLANIAPHDGTYLGMLGNTLVASQAVQADGVEFDARQFGWVGTIAPIVMTMTTWSSKGLPTMHDVQVKQPIAAASAKGAITYTFPLMMNQFLGANFKIVTGYEGLSDMSLAMERGEADAVASSLSGWKTTKPDWLKDKKIDLIVQTEPKSAELPNVPSVEELAKNDDDRQVIDLIVSGVKIGFPLVATPGVPPERLAMLRRAFSQAMRDPEFRKDAASMQLDVDPVEGEKLQETVGKLLDTRKDLVDRARPIISN
jgi:tripartite-type tricarboxylate transporter receptor subunit TctC